MNPYIEQAEECLIHTYNRYPVVFDRGEGVYLYDVEGKKYLDFMAGIAVFALGYGQKAFNDALKEQIDKIIHISNYFYSVPMAEAAKKVKEASGMDKVFFCNSGTEAVEGAIKLARKYTYRKNQRERYEIIAMNQSFHGRSTGALSVTGNENYRRAFEPLATGVKFADYNDLESVKRLADDKTCAVIMETVQGEGGIYPADQAFIEGVRKLCDEKDMLLILDEIQCGMGRCGSMYAFQEYGVTPDVCTTAKALGCGVPVGAFLARGKAADVLEAGDHGTTYGGNPLAMAAVSKVFDLFEEKNIQGHVREISPYLEKILDSFVERYDFIVQRRGKGLMQGLEFSIPVGEFIKDALKDGVVLISAGSNVIRFIPPLIIEKEHIDEMAEVLKKILDKKQ